MNEKLKELYYRDDVIIGSKQNFINTAKKSLNASTRHCRGGESEAGKEECRPGVAEPAPALIGPPAGGADAAAAAAVAWRGVGAAAAGFSSAPQIQQRPTDFHSPTR
jgi:hypothetical protein